MEVHFEYTDNSVTILKEMISVFFSSDLQLVNCEIYFFLFALLYAVYKRSFFSFRHLLQRNSGSVRNCAAGTGITWKSVAALKCTFTLWSCDLQEASNRSNVFCVYCLA